MRREHELYADSAQARATDRREEEHFDTDDPWPPLTKAELAQQRDRLALERKMSSALIGRAIKQMEARCGLEANRRTT